MTQLVHNIALYIHVTVVHIAVNTLSLTTMHFMLLVHFLDIRVLDRPMREHKYYSISFRSCENVGHDVTLLYAHWSVFTSNIKELKVDKQPKKHGYTVGQAPHVQD